jgi:hypothetical protein
MNINIAEGIQLENGEYQVDFKTLLNQATCKEEKEYIKEIKTYIEKKVKTTFPFKYQYIVKQSCGHYEIFQNPHLETIKPIVEQHSKNKCTSCICGFNK